MRRSKARKQWLVRRDGVDHGPYTTDELLGLIEHRTVDMGSELADVASMTWEPMGVYAQFRDHYATCSGKWEEQELHAETDRHARKLEAMSKVKGGTWKLATVGLLVLVGVGGLLVWRLAHAEPTGITSVLRTIELYELPRPKKASTNPPRVAQAAAQPVPVLEEKALRRRWSGTGSGTGSSGSVSGVRLEGQGPRPETSFSFDEDGKAAGTPLAGSAMDRIKREARQRLVRCGSKLTSSASVSFLVKSGRLGGFTVGKSAIKNRAFKACIKKQLRSISVPTFSGSERRVSVPLTLQ